MGILTYDSSLVARIDDRPLAHLQAVVWAKIRRGESFAFSWVDETGEYARASVWINPSISLSFQYDDAAPIQLNQEWLRALTKAANSATGLRLVDEPDHGRATVGEQKKN
jgi:hypothetical protein